MFRRGSRKHYASAIATILILAVALPLLGQGGSGGIRLFRPGSGGGLFGGGSGGGGSGGLGCPRTELTLIALDVCGAFPRIEAKEISLDHPVTVGEGLIRNPLDEPVQVTLSSESNRIRFEPSIFTLGVGDALRYRVAAVGDITDPNDLLIPALATGVRLNSGDDYDDTSFLIDLVERPFDTLMYPCELYEEIRFDQGATEDEILTEKLACITGLPIGKLRANSNQLLDELEAEDLIENIWLFEKGVDLTAQQLSLITLAAAGVFPCGGITPFGLFVCPPQSNPFAAGNYIMMSQVFDADIPLADAINFFQYAFVFDSDNNPNNNWLALPQFANDYFQGTDRWYVFDYDPRRLETKDGKGNGASGWILDVSQVVGTGDTRQITKVASGAFGLIQGNSVTIFIPENELPGSLGKGTTPAPQFRISSFRHAGDFGQNPPFNWSADYWPEIDEPLEPLLEAEIIVEQ